MDSPDNPADTALRQQQRLVGRYVAGDLSRSERAEFEAWLISSPELAAEVEMERRLRRGIASAARRGWLHRADKPGSERKFRLVYALLFPVLMLLMVYFLKSK